VFGGFHHEPDDFVGGVDDPETVRRRGIVGPIEIFVNDLEKTLFLVMVGDPGRGGLDDPDVGIDLS